MNTIAVLGGFFGDEAKAKIVDVLAGDVDAVVRFQGGNNAGHTIKIGNNKYVLHLVPAGIFYERAICIIGNGLVIDPFSLKEEIEALKNQGVVFKDRLFIDYRAHVVLPLHKELDIKYEDKSKADKIGTTGRGIGPCYTDKAFRSGIRMLDLLKKDSLVDKITKLYELHGQDTSECVSLSKRLLEIGEYFREYLDDIPHLLHYLHQNNKKILFEGAQGSLLDIDYGTYPFVTSSNTIIGGISIGTGFSPRKIEKMIGIFKSYITRVGNGPLVTELTDSVGEEIRERGNEYGSSTGRPRRCGWFDAVAARFSVLINDFDEAALTLLDVLQEFDTVKICYAYSINDRLYGTFPADTDLISSAEPVYMEMPGWKKDITAVRKYEDLPENARKYIEKISELIGIPITIISVGAEREQTIRR